MQLPPADILEEDDPVLEIETECRERVEDIERRDKDELDRLIRERLERKEARLAENAQGKRNVPESLLHRRSKRKPKKRRSPSKCMDT